MDLSKLAINEGQRPPTRPRRYHVLGYGGLALAIGVALWLLAGPQMLKLWQRVSPGGEREVVLVEARRAEAATDSELTTANAHVVARKTASLGSKVLGRLSRLHVDQGDRVEAGQILAELQHEDLDADVAAAEAEIRRAEADLIAARKSTELARARVDEAKASRASAEARKAEYQARLLEADRDLLREQALFDRGTVSENRRDEAQTERDALRARVRSLVADYRKETAGVAVAMRELELAQAKEESQMRALAPLKARLRRASSLREDAFIRAPFAGVVLRKEAEVGEIVAPSPGGNTMSRAAVLTMADFSTLELEVDVFERDIHLIELGAPASIRLDAYSDRPQTGAVRLIRPTADRDKATVQVKVAFSEIPPFARPEMAGTVVFLKPQAAGQAAAKSTVLVPTETVQRGYSRNFVWRFDDGRAREVRVELGDETGREIEILEGLSGGERLIVGPHEGFRDGMRVKQK
jgi:RND family efflux transporter MFP subunit